ncbi:hypothetical protein M569_04604 [Genlisea aurea]|uniref:Histone chaperone domain-containing protein n=1 Tax=Genlisea aurea TaxID=192259 RepID=S8CSC1_9LAMI|nr:hypothetical protein M569_04604 [Genlisea aurea]
MARVEVVEDGVEFPEKRKLDLSIAQPEEKADSDKRQRTEFLAGKNGFVSTNAAEDVEKSEDGGDASEEKEEFQEDDCEYNVGEEEEEEEEEDGDEEFKIVDAKGKGIVVDDKGKGKMVQENSEDEDSDCQNDDDDDDDSSDDSDGDFSDGLDDGDDDDPLAEVDLNNILPSRTRQRRVQPGIHIVNDKDNGD